MSDVVVTIKIMPEGTETDVAKVGEAIEPLIKEFGGEVGKTEIEPIAFGLNALKLFFVMDENLGSTEQLEEGIQKLDGVQSVEVTDVRRTIG